MNFKEISFISVKSDDLINFFHRGTKWINSINRNLNVTLNFENRRDLRQNVNRLVSIEFVVQGWLFFNRFYTFPNEDICLFKNFPHSQLVLPLIIFDPANFRPNECTCTLIWLIQYYKLFFAEVFQYITIDPEYENLLVNQTMSQCRISEKNLSLCNFSQRFEKCDFNSKRETFSMNGIFSVRFMLKWCQYVIEVYFRTIVCFIGLITNALTVKVIRDKRHAKNVSNSMYKHISFNAFFNILF